jgi:hypothetical protein
LKFVEKQIAYFEKRIIPHFAGDSFCFCACSRLPYLGWDSWPGVGIAGMTTPCAIFSNFSRGEKCAAAALPLSTRRPPSTSCGVVCSRTASAALPFPSATIYANAGFMRKNMQMNHPAAVMTNIRVTN